MRNFLVWTILFYLRFWAKLTLFLHRPYVIGIAGSVGKSSTRNALFAVLSEYFPTKVVSGNSETGVPLGILGLEIEGFSKKNWMKTLLKVPLRTSHLKKTKYLVVEMGIDDPEPPKNMSYLLSIVKPNMAIDLNATATHTMQFEKLLKRNTKDSLDFIMNKIAEEDSKIITNGYTKIGIYNADDERLRGNIEKNSKSTKLLTFGKDVSNNISYSGYAISTKKTKFNFILNDEKGERNLEVSLAGLLLSEASRESLAAVILAGIELGLKFSEIKTALEKNFSIPKGRSTLLPGIRGSLIIDSSYNSSKSTVLSFLDLLEILKKKTGRKAVFLMGDMRELGNESQLEHEEVAKRLVDVVDELYCVGPLTQEFVLPIVKESVGRKGKTSKTEWYKNAAAAGLHLKEELPQEALVLVKGSQNTLFLEEAIKFLLENPIDAKKLTRQEEYWQQIKQDFFNIEK